MNLCDTEPEWRHFVERGFTPPTDVKAVSSSHGNGSDACHLGLSEVVCGELVSVLQSDDGRDRPLVVLVRGELVLVEGDGGHEF